MFICVCVFDQINRIFDKLFCHSIQRTFSFEFLAEKKTSVKISPFRMDGKHVKKKKNKRVKKIALIQRRRRRPSYAQLHTKEETHTQN